MNRSRSQDSQPLLELALGDIVTLPDGATYSIRSLVKFKEAVEDVAGFLLLGEMEAVLAIPPATNAPVSMYLPVNRFPHTRSQTVSVADGVTRYWAPHLPSAGKAMGEIMYRVVTSIGSVTPTMVLYRGPDAVVYVSAGQFRQERLSVSCMPRDASNEDVVVQRHSGDVDVTPAFVPSSDSELYEVLTGAR